MEFILDEIVLSKDEEWGEERRKKFAEIFSLSVKILYPEISDEYQDKKRLAEAVGYSPDMKEDVVNDLFNAYQMKVEEYNALYGEDAYQMDENEILEEIKARNPEEYEIYRKVIEVRSLRMLMEAVKGLVQAAEFKKAELEFKLEDLNDNEKDRDYI